MNCFKINEYVYKKPYELLFEKIYEKFLTK